MAHQQPLNIFSECNCLFRHRFNKTNDSIRGENDHTCSSVPIDEDEKADELFAAVEINLNRHRKSSTKCEDQFPKSV